jgi:hypothetical protein
VSIKTVTQLTNAGGRAIHLDSPTVRALVAYQRFQPAFAAEHVEAWRRRDRPISSMAPIARMFEIAPSRPAAEATTASQGVEVPGNGEPAKPRGKAVSQANGTAAPARTRKASRQARPRPVAG